MTIVQTIAAFLEQIAPARLAEDWDNVGLLVGDRSRPVERVMTCLTITPATAAEAIEREAELIVTHHPLPFHPLERLTADTTSGRLLLQLISARVAVYSAHTAFDSAQQGINQRLAGKLGLRGITPMVPNQAGQGSGRWGWMHDPLTLGQMADRAKRLLSLQRLQLVGDPQQPIRTVAVACGAAGEFLDVARDLGCDCLLTGETRFHTCLEAEAAGMGLLMLGHFTSERFAMESLAELLTEQFPDLGVWASVEERDPVRWV